VNRRVIDLLVQRGPLFVDPAALDLDHQSTLKL
jgi:hypothetical protein